ncbi:hypothetical protein [Dyadobacter sp. 676]|uniref:Uncharacterized protein n=1 Tax=Dyadobacter sp. 676 TaxID=3088362 RepID=A0AAU8FRD2_9BACT
MFEGFGKYANGLLAVGVMMVLVGCARRSGGTIDGHSPAYEQIRLDPAHMNDLVVPQTMQGDFLPRASSYSVIMKSQYFGAFDFPADSVSYFLNGKRIKNKKRAEKEIKENAESVERVSIGEAGPDGRREIEIDYNPVLKKN